MTCDALARDADIRPPPSSQYRRLGVEDGRHLHAHFLRLHPEDLRQRFMGTGQRRLVGSYLRSIDWRRTVMVGCFIGRSLRGIGELHPISDRRGELALSVERRFQRRGVGGELLRRTLLLARNRGLIDLELRCMGDNAGVRRLVARLDGAVSLDFSEASGTIHSLPPTAATIGCELLEEARLFGSSLIRFWLERPPALWPSPAWATGQLFGTGKAERRPD